MKKYDIEKSLGCEVGICSFETVKEHLINCRNKQLLPKNAKSIILFVFPYNVKAEKPMNICRYATVKDYHTVCAEILQKYTETLKSQHKEYNFVHFVDNSPIPEVFAAANAGLGVVGKNGLLITKKYGSYVFIGEIVTDMEIDAENKAESCINCGTCEKVCPVNLNKEKCLSLLTQKKGELEEWEKTLIKQSGCIWGCDICADVCPMNKNVEQTDIEEFISSYRNGYTLGEDISGRAFAWRGEKVIKRNYEL